MFLFYDTESTGKANFGAKGHPEVQPHIVSICCVVTDAAGQMQAQYYSLVDPPEGVVIEPQARGVHGITIEMCRAYGVDTRTAIAIFGKLARKCGYRVAYNLEFDDLLLSTEAQRLGLKNPLPYHMTVGQCAMKMVTPICKIPNTGRGPEAYKWPKLSEAYRFFVGQDFEGAHNAMADVMALIRVYDGISAHQAANPDPSLTGNRRAAFITDNSN